MQGKKETTFGKGLAFVRNNPQIMYTLFLLVAITVSFLFTAQLFLDLTGSLTKRLEKDRVGLMQDVFVEFASANMANPEFLQERITAIAALDSTISEMRVLEKKDSSFQTIASLHEAEVGAFATDVEEEVWYSQATTRDRSWMFGTYLDGERHWVVVRGILDADDNVLGVLYTNISVAYVDALLASKRLEATYYLVFIILVIVLLLIRQARVVDYAALYSRLKEVDQMKDDFIGMAAHELRTPLTIIRGYADMLSDSQTLTHDDRQMTSNIKTSAEQLNMLVGDILDVSRIQQGRLSFEPAFIDASESVTGVVESLTYTAEKKGLALTHEVVPGRYVFADPDRLKQVIINLVGNAIKYTPKGSVEVSTGVADKRVTIRVSDTGMGISAEDQKNLFTRFYRVQNRETEDIRGTGLGLWISREIIRQMGGDITVESIKGKGTDFIVILPFKEASPSDAGNKNV